LIEVIIGALIAIFLTIFIEFQRKPRLEIETLETLPMDLIGSARLRVRNKPLPGWLRWLSRQPALQCHGNITFHNYINGQDIFGQEMQIRWVNLPEPLPIDIGLDNKIVGHIYDPVRILQLQRIDIYAGEYEDLDVAVKFHGEEICYGWNNESYRYSGRNPSWKLEEKQYLIRMSIRTAGEKITRIFRLLNPGTKDGFRIENSSSNDQDLIC